MILDDAEDKEFEQAFDEAASSEQPSDAPAEADDQHASEEDASGEASDKAAQAQIGDSDEESAPSADKDVEHQIKSDRGRIRALQKKIEELRAQSSDSHGDTKEGDNGVDIQSIIDNDPKWQRLREEYPELAEPIQETVAALVRRNEHLEQRLSQLVDALENARIEQEQTENIQKLSKLVPEWDAVIFEGGQVSQEWIDWVASQPRHIQEAVARNAEQIVDADEAAHVIRQFMAERGIRSGVSSSDPVRAMKMRGGSAPVGRQASLASGPPDEFEAAFDWFDKQLSRSRKD